MNQTLLELEIERQEALSEMAKWREETRSLSVLLDSMKSAVEAEEIQIINAAGGYSALGKNDAERKQQAATLLLASKTHQKAKTAVSTATADLAFAKEAHGDATRRLNSVCYRMQLEAELIRAYGVSAGADRIMESLPQADADEFEPVF